MFFVYAVSRRGKVSEERSALMELEDHHCHESTPLDPLISRYYQHWRWIISTFILFRLCDFVTQRYSVYTKFRRSFVRSHLDLFSCCENVVVTSEYILHFLFFVSHFQIQGKTVVDSSWCISCCDIAF